MPAVLRGSALDGSAPPGEVPGAPLGPPSMSG